jgi:hypothetical protein
MKTYLVILLSIVAITAVAGGGMLLSAPDGSSLNLSLGLLTYSPFRNYFIPGLILLFIVGGSHWLALFLLIKKSEAALKFSVYAGVIICGWIIAQALIFSIQHWLQFVYLLMGTLIILLSFQLLKKEFI